MKKLIIILSAILFGVSMKANAGRTEFVATKDGVYYFKHVRYNNSNYLLAIDREGEVQKFDKEEVLSYTQKGKQYIKLPLFDDKMQYLGQEFLELIASKNGLKVFASGTSAENYNMLVYKDKTFMGKINNLQELDNYF